MLLHATEDFVILQKMDQCPFCGCQHIYRQKDFNRKLGVGLLALGAVAAFFTYGLSMVAVALLDWSIYRRVGWVGCCYQCGAQFRGAGRGTGRGTESINELPVFELGLHDYYKNIEHA